MNNKFLGPPRFLNILRTLKITIQNQNSGFHRNPDLEFGPEDSSKNLDNFRNESGPQLLGFRKRKPVRISFNRQRIRLQRSLPLTIKFEWALQTYTMLELMVLKPHLEINLFRI